MAGDQQTHWASKIVSYGEDHPNVSVEEYEPSPRDGRYSAQDAPHRPPTSQSTGDPYGRPPDIGGRGEGGGGFVPFEGRGDGQRDVYPFAYSDEPRGTRGSRSAPYRAYEKYARSRPGGSSDAARYARVWSDDATFRAVSAMCDDCYLFAMNLAGKLNMNMNSMFADGWSDLRPAMDRAREAARADSADVHPVKAPAASPGVDYRASDGSVFGAISAKLEDAAAKFGSGGPVRRSKDAWEEQVHGTGMLAFSPMVYSGVSEAVSLIRHKAGVQCGFRDLIAGRDTCEPFAKLVSLLIGENQKRASIKWGLSESDKIRSGKAVNDLLEWFRNHAPRRARSPPRSTTAAGMIQDGRDFLGFSR